MENIYEKNRYKILVLRGTGTKAGPNGGKTFSGKAGVWVAPRKDGCGFWTNVQSFHNFAAAFGRGVLPNCAGAGGSEDFQNRWYTEVFVWAGRRQCD